MSEVGLEPAPLICQSDIEPICEPEAQIHIDWLVASTTEDINSLIINETQGDP